MSIFTLRMVLVLLGVLTLASYQIDITPSPRTGADTEKITGFTSALQASEWLGPLAPIAISPFFGITILSGVSQFGGAWIESNSFVSDNPVLSNPRVFWIFLGLTILTSIPRFTKVSKPAAQAIDQLEAYAGIITIIVIRVVTAISESEPVGPETAMVVQAGMFSFSADVLFSVVAVINIIVINTVKFFFEVMIWLVPVPFIDGLLEIANKSLCLGLMAIYFLSPMAATLLNLILFTACLIAFRWVNRRVTYLRSVLWDPLWGMISKSYGNPIRKELVVFPQNDLGPFPAKSKLLLQTTDDGWQLVQARLLFGPKQMQLSRSDYRLIIRSGILLNSILVQGDERATLLFSRRYSSNIHRLAALINIEEASNELPTDTRSDLADA